MSVGTGNVPDMPSSLHEALVQLFRSRPALAAEILAGTLHQHLPAYSYAEAECANLPKLKTPERNADTVVVLYQLKGKPVLAVVVEIQLQDDKSKKESWPDYLTTLHSRYHCPAMLLVVSPNRRTARLAAEPIEIGHPGFVVRPLVLGPGLIPVVTDADEAVATPEAAILSGIAHGRRTAARRAAFAAVGQVAAHDIDLAALYADVIMAELPKALRKTAEAELRSGTIEYRSDFAKRYFAQGEAQGEARGEARGEVRGEAKAVLAVLEARKIEVTPDARAQILGCSDLAQLDAWVRRAATADSVDELFR
jgi:hypothetical protein